MQKSWGSCLCYPSEIAVIGYVWHNTGNVNEIQNYY